MKSILNPNKWQVVGLVILFFVHLTIFSAHSSDGFEPRKKGNYTSMFTRAEYEKQVLHKANYRTYADVPKGNWSKKGVRAAPFIAGLNAILEDEYKLIVEPRIFSRNYERTFAEIISAEKRLGLHENPQGSIARRVDPDKEIAKLAYISMCLRNSKGVAIWDREIYQMYPESAAYLKGRVDSILIYFKNVYGYLMNKAYCMKGSDNEEKLKKIIFDDPESQLLSPVLRNYMFELFNKRQEFLRTRVSYFARQNGASEEKIISAIIYGNEIYEFLDDYEHLLVLDRNSLSFFELEGLVYNDRKKILQAGVVSQPEVVS